MSLLSKVRGLYIGICNPLNQFPFAWLNNDQAFGEFGDG